MNEMRSSFYESFVKVSKEKAKERTGESPDKRANKVYTQINSELQELKDKLRKAGVSRRFAPMDPLEEEEEQSPQKRKISDNSPQKAAAHTPKIDAQTMKDFTRNPKVVDRPGIPKPVANNFIKPQTSELPIDQLSMRSTRQNQDFRITANSSRGSFGGISGRESNQAKPIAGRRMQRPNLIGANKPHLLQNQNDSIRQMLGPSTESKIGIDTLDPKKPRRQNSLRASQNFADDQS